MLALVKLYAQIDIFKQIEKNHRQDVLNVVGKSLSKYVKERIHYHHSLMISLQLEVATKNETKNIVYNTESRNSAKTPTKK